jgi:hypothetical protein
MDLCCARPPIDPPRRLELLLVPVVPDCSLIRVFARLAVLTAIALAFLAQLILVEARPPQFLTISLPTLTVTATVDVDASRSNLNTLRECRNGGEKSRCGNDRECIHAH